MNAAPIEAPKPRESAEPARVLVLLNSLALGGAETFAVSFAAAADRKRFDVRMGYLRGDNLLGPSLRAAGVPIVKFPASRSLDIRAIAALVGYLRRERIDVIQTHLSYSGILGRFAARIAGVPVVVSTEQVILLGQPLAARRLDELTLGLADTVVCISEGVLESFAGEGVWGRLSSGVRRVVIPNGVDLVDADRRIAGRDPNLRATLGLAPDDFVIGNVGRLVEQKGQRHLIEAFRRVLPEVPRARLVVAGKGPLMEELRGLVRDAGVEPRVRLLGERKDIYELMATMDLFAFPSNFEGLGVVLVEALAARLPVVASRIPGVVDVIEHDRTGLLVPPRDPQAVADAIVALAGDPARARALAAAGRERVEKRFSIDVVTRRYEALYTELLAEKGRRLPAGAGGV